MALDLKQLEQIAKDAAGVYPEEWFALGPIDYNDGSPLCFEIGNADPSDGLTSFYEDIIATVYGGNYYDAEAHSKFIATFSPKLVLELLEVIKLIPY